MGSKRSGVQMNFSNNHPNIHIYDINGISGCLKGISENPWISRMEATEEKFYRVMASDESVFPLSLSL